MRYGLPPIAERIKSLQADGCDRILVVPLYPQYCAASTATVGDKVFETLQAMRWQPAVRIAAPYYDDPSISTRSPARSAPASRDWISSPRSSSPPSTAFRRTISSRAIPITAIAPRRRGCSREALGLRRSNALTFQSRFGRAEWLKPYTG